VLEFVAPSGRVGHNMRIASMAGNTLTAILCWSS
jgi:hypothetical protein